MNNLTPPVVCVCLFLILGMLITPRVIYAENPEMTEPLSALQEVEKQINVEEDTEDPLHRWRRLQEERVMREMQETPVSACVGALIRTGKCIKQGLLYVLGYNTSQVLRRT